MKIRYDLVVAERNGIKTDPAEQMKKLGFIVTDALYLHRVNHWQFTVERNQLKLPEYLTVDEA